MSCLKTESALEKLKRVVDNDLCTRCGGCVGLSQGKVKFRDELGECLPDLPGDLDEKLAERMWNSCSGEEVDFNGLNRFCFGDDAGRDPFMGHYEGIFIGNCTDPEVRKRSASGGILTSALIHLLGTGRIQGAVVTGMHAKQPWRPATIIATTEEEILQAAQSKYVITTPNTILPEVEKFDGRLAYVGLPCQVHSIRKLQMARDPSVAKIDYVLGPFCGNNLHYTSILSFLRSHGVRDYREVTKLAFREGEWPGKMRIELKSGRWFEIPKFHANYLIPFHIMTRCTICTDFTNEFTDLSGGDAWAPVYEERGKGFSLVITRSPKGRELAEEMKAGGAWELIPKTYREAVRMHSVAYDFKKRGAFIRLGWRKRSGKPVPDYNYEIRGFTGKRILMEAVIVTLLKIFRSPVSVWLCEKIPQPLMGWIFVRFRKFWRKITYKIKRENMV